MRGGLSKVRKRSGRTSQDGEVRPLRDLRTALAPPLAEVPLPAPERRPASCGATPPSYGDASRPSLRRPDLDARGAGRTRRSGSRPCSAPGSTRAGRRTSASCSTTRPTTSSRSAAPPWRAAVAGLNHTRRGEHLGPRHRAHRRPARHHRAAAPGAARCRRSTGSTFPAGCSCPSGSPTATTRPPWAALARAPWTRLAPRTPASTGRRSPTSTPSGSCCSRRGRRRRPRRCAAPSAGCSPPATAWR